MKTRSLVCETVKIIIELKSVDAIAPVHHKQLLTYLKMTKIKLGLLVINAEDPKNLKIA